MVLWANDSAAQGSAASETALLGVWGALSAAPSGPDGSLTTSYSPPLLFDGDFISSGGQTLAAATGTAVGFTAGFEVFPTKHLGFQIVFDRSAFDVSGANAPYSFALQYESRPPPDNVPRIVNVNRSTPWADTSGSLSQTAIAFNAALRVGRLDRVVAVVSGGPTYYRLSGELQPIAYTSFRLGGHSVLFQDDYRLALAAGPANALGFDAGGEVDIAVGRQVALVAGYRYFGGPDADVAVRATGVVNEDQVIFQQPLGDIASRLALKPMQVSPSSARVFIGLKLTP
jgi:hypothetical protein